MHVVTSQQKSYILLMPDGRRWSDVRDSYKKNPYKNWPSAWFLENILILKEFVPRYSYKKSSYKKWATTWFLENILMLKEFVPRESYKNNSYKNWASAWFLENILILILRNVNGCFMHSYISLRTYVLNVPLWNEYQIYIFAYVLFECLLMERISNIYLGVRTFWVSPYGINITSK